MKLSDQIAEISAILQETRSDLYVKAFRNKGISALTIGRFRYLEVINKNPGITPGRLSDIFEVKKPTVTQIINELLKKGLIEKSISQSDKRVSKLFPTDTTIDIINYRNSMFKKFSDKIKKVLSEQQLSQYQKLNSLILNKIRNQDKEND